MLQKLHVIIPTKNRHSYLQRVYAFYSEFDHPITIVDSSEHPYQAPTVPNIEYIHSPGTAFLKKIRLALDRVPSQYVLLASDDDFFLARSVEEVLAFLEANRDYASAQGLYRQFNRIGPFIHRPIYPETVEYDLNANDSSARVSALWGNYIQLYYAVHRAEVFQVVVEKGEELDFHITGLNLFELFLSTIAAIHGKHKVINSLYGMRESNYHSSGSTHHKLWTIRDEIHLQSYFERFKLTLARELSRIAGIPFSEAIPPVEQAIGLYFQKFSFRKRPFFIRAVNAAFRKIRSALVKKPTVEMDSRIAEMEKLFAGTQDYLREVGAVESIYMRYPIAT